MLVSWCFSQHHTPESLPSLPEANAAVNLTAYLVKYVTYVDSWYDVYIIASTTASALWHHCWHHDICIISGITWNESGCQSINAYLVLLHDLCRCLAWCLSCFQDHSIGIMMSLPASVMYIPFFQTMQIWQSHLLLYVTNCHDFCCLITDLMLTVFLTPFHALISSNTIFTPIGILAKSARVSWTYVFFKTRSEIIEVLLVKVCTEIYRRAK